MSFQALTTKIKLAYPAISAYEFELLKEEKVVQEYIENSMIYILAQRPVLSFENIEYVEFDEGNGLTFEIHKQGSNTILKCEFPFIQFVDESEPENNGMLVEFGTHSRRTIEKSDIYNDIHGMKFFDIKENFLFWLSPDKFIYEVLNKHLIGKINGKLDEFISFKVHYVGKATDQKIWERLTGHDTLQKILTVQNPMVDGNLPAHEITLLLLKVADLQSVKIVDSADDFLNGYLPSEKTVSLDIEKMLVKIFNPNFNHHTKRFPNYPKSKDGLHQYNYNNYSYQLVDDIILEYNETQICGNLDENKADLILISENQSVEVLKL